MNTSPNDVINMALAHLANQVEIQDYITETTQEAQTARRFYENVRQEMLRDFWWPFATRFITLAAVAGPNPPATTEYAMSYRLPQDCLRARRILSGTRLDTWESQVPYTIASDSQGGLIFTDYQPVVATSVTPAMPIFEYTALVTDETKYYPDFLQAMAFRLAFYMAPRLTKGDEFGLGKRADQNYMLFLERAKDAAMNEMKLDKPNEAEFIRAREGEYSFTGTLNGSPPPMFPAAGTNE